MSPAAPTRGTGRAPPADGVGCGASTEGGVPRASVPAAARRAVRGGGEPRNLTEPGVEDAVPARGASGDPSADGVANTPTGGAARTVAARRGVGRDGPDGTSPHAEPDRRPNSLPLPGGDTPLVAPDGGENPAVPDRGPDHDPRPGGEAPSRASDGASCRAERAVGSARVAPPGAGPVRAASDGAASHPVPADGGNCAAPPDGDPGRAGRDRGASRTARVVRPAGPPGAAPVEVLGRELLPPPRPGRRAAVLGLLALGGCGFTPALQPGDRGRFALAVPDTRPGFTLRQRLEERLGPAGTGAPYRIEATVALDPEVSATDDERVTTRVRLEGRADYAIVEATTGRERARGDAIAFAAYDATGTTVALDAAARDAEDRLLAILADRIAARVLAADLP